MHTQQSKESRDTPPGVLAFFVIKKVSVNNRSLLKHWQEITKDNLELQWPFGSFYNLDKTYTNGEPLIVGKKKKNGKLCLIGMLMCNKRLLNQLPCLLTIHCQKPPHSQNNRNLKNLTDTPFFDSKPECTSSSYFPFCYSPEALNSLLDLPFHSEDLTVQFPFKIQPIENAKENKDALKFIPQTTFTQ